MSCPACRQPDATVFYVGATRVKIALCSDCQLGVLATERLRVQANAEYPDDVASAKVLQACVNVIWDDLRREVLGHHRAKSTASSLSTEQGQRDHLRDILRVLMS